MHAKAAGWRRHGPLETRGLIVPVQRATPTTRCPPSHVVVFEALPPPPSFRCHSPWYGPAVPLRSHLVSHGPLSPLSHTRVCASTAGLEDSDAMMSPTVSSSSSSVS